MKNLLILIFAFTMNFGWGQYFEQSSSEIEESHHQFFSESSFDSEPNVDYNKNSGSPGGPGEPAVPIDNWAFVLPILAVGIGVYFLRRRVQDDII